MLHWLPLASGCCLPSACNTCPPVERLSDHCISCFPPAVCVCRLVAPGSPRSAQQLLQEEQEDAVPGGLPLPPQQQQPAGTDVLEHQVRQALLRHGLSQQTSRTRSEVAAAVRPHLPSPSHLPTVMECTKLVRAFGMVGLLPAAHWVALAG